MRVKYQPSFIKDLKALKSTSVFQQIKRLVFEEIPTYQEFVGIANLKKLKTDSNAYRIRVGDYRIGFLWEGDTIIFERVLHRKEIYRYFP
jgi:mRNA interferase RelE/StbE